MILKKAWRIFSSFFMMWPRIRKYGISYYYDKGFRKRCKKYEVGKRQKRLYGSSFLAKRSRIKQAMFRANGNICFWCNKPMKSKNATIDHIIPISKGGGNEYFNLRLVHDLCRVERDRQIQKGLIKASPSFDYKRPSV